MKRRSRLKKVLLGVAVLTVIAAAFAGLGPKETAPAVARTVTVGRGTVLASVSATGNVTAETELGLDFATGGKLVELAVAEGDQVTPGQILARTDGRSESDNLAAANADLASARAELARVREGTTPAERAADQARVARAQSQVAGAESALEGAQAAETANADGYTDAVTQARTAVSQARARADRNARTYRDDIEAAEDEVEAARRADSDAGDRDDIIGRLTGAADTAEAELRAARARVVTARNAERTGRLTDSQAIKNASDEVTNAQNRATTGRVADRQAVNDAVAGVNAARADLSAAIADARVAQAPATAAEVAVAQAGVARAQASVNAARADVADATLVAPVAGTVARIASDVGEFVDNGGIGGDLDSVAGAENGSTATTASTNGFIVLTDLASLQVKAGFSEVDAARVRPGQAVILEFEALPRQTIGGRVARIDPTSTLVRNVVTYNVTVVLNSTVEGIRPGMTASTQIVVGERTGVPRLPSAAVGGRADRPMVKVLRAGKPQAKPVTVGLRGDDSIEVVGGLAPGDSVVARFAEAGEAPPGRPGS